MASVCQHLYFTQMIAQGLPKPAAGHVSRRRGGTGHNHGSPFVQNRFLREALLQLPKFRQQLLNLVHLLKVAVHKGGFEQGIGQ